jgi:hypothetical protein
MKNKVTAILLLVSLFFSCATGYSKTTVDNARFGKGFDPFRTDTYKAVSEAYIINASSNTITIADSNDYPYYGLDLNISEDIANRFDPNKKYTIRYSVVFQYHGSPQSAYVDSIEGLDLVDTAIAEEQPENTLATYLEKSLDEINKNGLTVREAYSRNDDYLYYKIVSPAYIKTESKSSNIVIYDGTGNDISVASSTGLDSLYNIRSNSDFNPNKSYIVKYTLRIHSNFVRRSNILAMGNSLVPGFDYRSSVCGADLISIEGLLTYHEAREKQNQEKAKQTQEREEQEARETLAKHIAMDNVYATAVSSQGIELLKEYINTYAGDDHFNADSYLEIARRITRNNNITLEMLYTAPNPYAFSEGVVYYGGTLSVNQWIDKKAVAYISSFIRDDGNIIVIKSFPDISKIGHVIQHSFLRYAGVTKIGLSNGGTIERPTFDLLCHW